MQVAGVVFRYSLVPKLKIGYGTGSTRERMV